MDELVKKYFPHNPESFGIAMDLLMQYEKYSKFDLSVAEEQFLSRLEEDEDVLLSQALNMQREREQLRLNDVTSAKEKDELINHYQKTIDYLTSRVHQPITQQPTAYSEEEDPKLSVLIKKWLSYKKFTKIKDSSLDSLTQRIDIFHKIIVELNGSEPTVSQVTTALIRQFCEVIKTVPAHRNAKILAGKSLVELSKLGLAPISDKTHEEYLNTSADLFTWANTTDYPINEKLAGILSSNKVKKSKQKVDEGEPFDNNDILKIFNSEWYSSGAIKRASDYWVPLIALFSGARLGEICQLSLTDIYQEGAYWVIDINEDFDDGDNVKSIKNSVGSKRIVPIHPKLKELGLIEYRALVLSKGESRLFPDEQRNETGKFGAISKRFSHKIKTLGVKQTEGKNKRKSFHSFRHTVRTRLKEASPTESAIIDMIVGHESKERSTGETTYTHTQLIPHKVKLLAKLAYPIEYDKVIKWDSCIFARELRIKKNQGRLK